MPRQTEGTSVALEAVGGFARRVSLKDEICRPSPSASTTLGRQYSRRPQGREGSQTPEPAVNRAACIAELALHLEESRSRHILEVEREKTKRARDIEEAERRLQKATEHHLDRCLRVETAVANMAADIKRTQDAIDRMDIPNKLEGLRKALEVRPTTYAAAAAKPKLQMAAKPDQVVKAIREVVDAREKGVGVDRVRKTRNQKVVLTCASDDAIKRIETRIKIKSKDLQVSKPEPSLPLVIIRDVLKVNSDQQIIESLKRQNGHATEGLDWGKVEARVECHPVLEVSPALYTRLIKAGFVYVGLQRRPVWDQSPLVQCSRCLGFGHSKKYCREQNDKCAHCGSDHTGPLCPGRKAAQSPKCINCTRACCEDVAHSAFSQECGVRAKWDAIARTKVAYC
ncbi:hypothetical protein EVAR_252_1 [Eumeta japonica]|uniref:Nucleic-acid-binding protein from transposon X-element n=1 Tax=Eumeta variegata TaxID=151549 RepID=A0A4C1S951_EUMVA|nr:hypothetical protein EVAR_252_1 [Eumeta japonica]